jgi:peptidoglycan/LPS O-acetylase OafA/YrhL
MIGFIRLFLALVVMSAHLGATPSLTARVAVIGFYVLAGYFGVGSLLKTYQGHGVRFFVFRYLRIWPSFAVVFTASMALLWSGWSPRLGVMGVPSLERILLQFLLFPSALNPLNVSLVVPPAWMMPLMLLWWAAMASGLAHAKDRALMWLCSSLAFMISVQAWPWTDWYYSILYPGAWFAVGAVAYHSGVQVPRDGRWGQWAGALSYPIFLCHYGVGAILPVAYGWPLFFAALLPTLSLSWALVVFVERPVSKFRKP